MKRIQGHFKYYLLSSKSDLKFVLIFIGIFTVIKLFKVYLAQEVITGDSLELVRFSSMLSFFYLFGIGINNTFESFPFMLSLSSTRKEFYFGVIGKYLLISGLFSGVLTLVYSLEKLIYGLLRVEYSGLINLYGRHLSNGFALFLILFIIYMVFLSFYGIVGALMLRFKMKFMLAGMVLAVVFYVLYPFIPGLENMGVNIFAKLITFYTQEPTYLFTFKLTLLIIIFLGLGWLMFRKAEIKVFDKAAS